jgi:hypothetical protein
MGGLYIIMAIADDTWQRWIPLLEEMLQFADVHGAHKFGIHIDGAIIAAHASLGTERRATGHDNSSDQTTDPV